MTLFGNEANDDAIGGRMTISDARNTQYDMSQPGVDVTIINETVTINGNKGMSYGSMASSIASGDNMYFNVGLLALGVLAVVLLSQ